MKEMIINLEEMESKERTLVSTKTQQSSAPDTENLVEKNGDENGAYISFINHAETAWNERRNEWIGDRSKRPSGLTKEPIISWSTTYDDLLSTNQHFPQRIPLAEMVDFLVDIWHEDGLYD